MANDQIDNKSKHSSLIKMNSDEINHNSSDKSSTDISLDDHTKTISQISAVKTNEDSINDQSIEPPCDSTNELAQSGDTSHDITPSKPIKNQHHNKSPIKTNSKSSKHAVQDHPPNEDDNSITRQRSLSSSSVSSTDSSKSNDNQTSNIPYETLYNDEDDDDLPEQTTHQISS